MDLHVFEGSVRATAIDPDPLIEAFEDGYATVGDDDVLDRLRDVVGPRAVPVSRLHRD